MEILFMGQGASTEAILIFLVLGIFLAFALYDGFRYVQRVFHIFTPKKSEVITPETLGVLTIAPESPEQKQELEEQAEVVSDGLTLSSTSQEEAQTEEVASTDTPQLSEEIQDNIQAEGGVNPEVLELAQDFEESIVPPELQVSESITNTVSVTNEAIIDTPIIENSEGTTTGEQEESPIPLELPSESLIVEKAMANTVNPDEVVMPELIEPIEEKIESLEETEEQEQETDLIETEEEILPETVQENTSPEIFSEEEEGESEQAPHETIKENPNNTPTESTTNIVEASGEMPKSPEHTETLFAITNNVRTLIARGQTLEARGLIIQGLALNKNHRELNMMLAGLYEQDHHFEKAEYIYKDLAIMHQNDIEILEKLGNVLIIQRRYEIALEMYKKILSLTGETEGTLYILSHLAKELEQFDVAYEYTRKYQKQWPNNPEILTILAQAEVAIGNRKDAIQTLIKLKNLTPYNQEITDMIQKLVLEEELAGNFQPE